MSLSSPHAVGQSVVVHLEYDPDADAAYVRLVRDVHAGEVAKTYCCDPPEVDRMINLDFDAAGRLVGIGVMDASKKLRRATLQAAG